MIIEQLSNDKKLTPSEKQIAKAILEYPRFVINLSLEKLSQQCFVSQASIIRFCKKLGAKGFADFKIQLATELNSFALNNQKVPVDIPIPPNANFETVSETMYQLSQESLESAFRSLDKNAIKRAANQLSRADLIHIYGRGESLILAEDFHYKLIRLGINSRLESLHGFQEASSIHSTSKIREIALVISQYCNSQQINYIIDELMNAHIPFILLTATENPWPYNHYATITLKFPSEETRHKMGSFSSRTAALYVLDCLYGYMFSLNYEENKRKLDLLSQRKSEREYFYRHRNL